MLVITSGGIRFLKATPPRTAVNSYPTKLFEFNWKTICSFRINNKKFILRQEDQPSCRKLVYNCVSHKRARYLLMLITQTHIFDFHQQKMYKVPNLPTKSASILDNEKRAVENSVDEWSPKRTIVLEDYMNSMHMTNNIGYPEEVQFYVDVSSSTLKNNNPASRALSVSTPKRPELNDRLQVKIPRHVSMSGVDDTSKRTNGQLRLHPIAPALPQVPPTVKKLQVSSNHIINRKLTVVCE